MPQQAETYRGQLLFFNDHRKSLTPTQFILLISYIILFFVNLITAHYAVLQTKIYVQTFTLRSIHRDGFKPQSINYTFHAHKWYAFQNDIVDSLAYALDNNVMRTPHIADQKDPRHKGLLSYIECHISAARLQWQLCFENSHRAAVFRLTALLGLTLGLICLNLVPMVMVINRKNAIRLNSWAISLLFLVHLLKLAAAEEYDLCLQQLQASGTRVDAFGGISLRHRFEVTYYTNKGYFLAMSVTVVFLSLPLLLIGTDLLWLHSENI